MMRAEELEISPSALLKVALHNKVLSSYFNLLDIPRWKTVKASLKRLLWKNE